MTGGSALSAFGVFDEQPDVFAAATDHGGDVDLLLPGVDGFEDGGAFGGDGSFAGGGGLLEAPHRGRVVVGHGFDDATLVGQMTMLVTAGRPLTLPKEWAKIVGMTAAVATLTEQATCTDHACLNALSDESLCDCSTCYGDGHGHAHRATRQAARNALQRRYVQPGFTAAMLAATDDDEAF